MWPGSSDRLLDRSSQRFDGLARRAAAERGSGLGIAVERPSPKHAPSVLLPAMLRRALVVPRGRRSIASDA